MDVSSPKPIFSDTSLKAEEPQRPFRVSGMLSLVFGVISIAVLASTSLLFLPCLAILFAAIAFRPTRDPQVIPAGRSLAVLGATLALLFAGWSVAQQTLGTRYLAAEGEKLARNWLAVLADGQQEFAFELTLPPDQRQLESMSLVQYYQSDPRASEQFQGFTSSSPVQAVVNATEALDWEFVDCIGVTWANYSDQIALQFQDRSGQIPQPIVITLIRISPLPSSSGAEPVEWIVKRLAFAKGTDGGPGLASEGRSSESLAP